MNSMSVPIDFLRGLVGLIGVGCAYMLARSVVSVHQGRVRIAKLYGWVIRVILCLAAVWYPLRGDVDTVDVAIWVLSAVVFAVGYWDASRVKAQEDLTHEMFPESGEDSGRSAER